MAHAVEVVDAVQSCTPALRPPMAHSVQSLDAHLLCSCVLGDAVERSQGVAAGSKAPAGQVSSSQRAVSSALPGSTW